MYPNDWSPCRQARQGECCPFWREGSGRHLASNVEPRGSGWSMGKMGQDSSRVRDNGGQDFWDQGTWKGNSGATPPSPTKPAALAVFPFCLGWILRTQCCVLDRWLTWTTAAPGRGPEQVCMANWYVEHLTATPLPLLDNWDDGRISIPFTKSTSSLGGEWSTAPN